jgi:hypothetical protein
MCEVRIAGRLTSGERALMSNPVRFGKQKQRMFASAAAFWVGRNSDRAVVWLT